MSTSRIFLMRHGEAGFDAASDIERSLTARGLASLDRLVEREAQRLSPVSAILSSPYRRALQTAERVQKRLGVPLLEPDAAFTPDRSVADALAALERAPWQNLLLVSHQPLLGNLVATLVHGDARYPEPMMPGSLAIVELDWPAAGLGHLLARLDP